MQISFAEITNYLYIKSLFNIYEWIEKCGLWQSKVKHQNIRISPTRRGFYQKLLYKENLKNSHSRKEFKVEEGRKKEGIPKHK